MCDSQIGWRANATKIVLFATDGGFHLAGDGKLAGIVEPNDETCHLNAAGSYTGYERYDYPSVNQINMVSQGNRINVIFAVTRSLLPIYTELSNQTELSSVAELSTENLAKLIYDQYKKITSQVRLIDTRTDATSSAVIKYVGSSCPRSSSRTPVNPYQDQDSMRVRRWRENDSYSNC